MNKFTNWSDEEIQELIEAFDVCWAEGIGPSGRGIEEAILAECETRELEMPWWTDFFRGSDE